jgi:predicted RNA-binding Zn-ribbon protein involved in translation (DUF1610 family)
VKLRGVLRRLGLISSTQMLRTLRLPDSLDGAEIASYLKKDMQPVRAGDPILEMMRRQSGVLRGESQMLVADADGVLLRQLMDKGKPCRAGMPMALLGDAGDDVGYDPRRVRPVRLMVLRKCSECGSEYPLNGFVERTRCARCGDVQIASPSFWSEHVGQAVFEANEPRRFYDGSLDDGHGQSRVQAWGVPPFCRKCQCLLEWSAVREAAEKAQQQPANVFCGQCGEPHRVRLRPAWAKAAFGAVTLLLGETAHDAAESRAAQPVVFKCPECLAPLKIDGDKRIVRCGQCNCDVYLPDDLWLHFNPAMKRTRWWMFFET